ncbi:EboA domain-containing protein [Limibacter armeniacum]|uniref:EboA domain-containing protein n=1 Tax=Limibacter armeniacum TaxID=466084 RepID=UPI002FE6599F
MDFDHYSLKLTQSKECLSQIISSFSTKSNTDWLTLSIHAATFPIIQELRYCMAFSLVSRYFSSTRQPDLNGYAEEFEKLYGCKPVGWSEVQFVRSYLLLILDWEGEVRSCNIVKNLIDTADMMELEAIYKTLPLLPYPSQFVSLAEEGVRTNMTNVFDAITQNNPFPAAYLEENAWNQLVVKSIFTDRPIYRLIGADKRSNTKLSKILIDYVKERWAAHRDVSPELWRFVGEYAPDDFHFLMKKLLSEGSPFEQAAAFLACKDDGSEEAMKLIEKLGVARNNKDVTWDDLGVSFWEQKQIPEGYQQAGSGYAPIDIE